MKEELQFCEFCDHHKPRMSINYDKEVYKCWVCEASGHLSQLPSLKGTFKSKEFPLTQNKAKSLEERGITIKSDAVVSQGSLVEFKQYNPSTGNFDAYQSKDYISGRYYTHGNVPGFFTANPSAWKDCKRVLIVEGAEDSLSALQMIEDEGLDEMICVASTGTSKLALIKPYLDSKGIQEVYVCMDRDKAGRKAQKGFMELLNQELKEVAVYDCELTEEKDINDLLLAKKDLKSVLSSAKKHEIKREFRPCIAFYEEMRSYLIDPTKSEGLPTTLKGLDKLLGGGQRAGEINVIVAQAKQGKSSLFAELISRMVEAGQGIGYMSRELPPDNDVIPNICSIVMKKNLLKFKDLPDKEQILKDIKFYLNKWKLSFMRGTGTCTIEQIRQYVKDAKKIHGTKIFFLDHFHKCLTDSEDKNEIAKYISDLSALVKEERICLWCIIQPTKIGMDGVISMNSMRGSVALQQEVDQIFILQRVPDVPFTSKLTLDNCRHKLAGPPGGSIYIQYDPTTTSIREVRLENDTEKGSNDHLNMCKTL